MWSRPHLRESDVFLSGRDGYDTYRIPSLIVTLEGTVLALSEGRGSVSDSGDIDIVLRRSLDGGVTWDRSKTIFPGISGYSALSVLPDGNLGCLYEKGDLSKLSIFDKIVLARFSAAWMFE